jgi:YVTN family beta-propeller protein/VCBS repeat-containing protein
LTVTDYTQPTHGTVVLNPNGTFTYSPGTAAQSLDTGETLTDTFTYTVSDEASPWHLHGLAGFFGGGGHASTATVTVTVTGVNDPPVAGDDEFTTPEDTPFTLPSATGDLMDNDTDVDGDPLTITANTDPANGTVIVSSDGSFVYTPDPDFNGTDTFTYTVSDGTLTDTATVTINVTPANDANVAPVASDTGEGSVFEDSVGVGSLAPFASDADGDALTFSVVTNPTNGVLTLDPNGDVTYTPNADFNGADSFTYRVFDGTAYSNVATASITVIPVNDGAPVADNDTATLNEGQSVAINVLDGDTDPDGNTTIDPTSVQIVTPPANGSTSIDPVTGEITYLHDGSETTTDSFTYTVNDNFDTTSNAATVNITITPVNDAPVAGSPAFAVDSINEANGVVGGHVNVADPDSGTVTYSLANPIDSAIGTVTVNSTTGVWTFTPTSQARLNALNSPGDDTIGFTINATDGQHITPVSVSAPIDPPAAAVTGSISAGPLPQGVAVVGDRLYVVNQNPGTVTVIDLTTNTVIDLNPATPAIDRIAVGSAPYATAVYGTRLYVANINSDSVTIIDTTTNTVIDANPATPAIIDPIPVGNGPQGMTISGDRLYVVNSFDDTVTVIDLTTNTRVDTNPATPAIIDPITVGNNPFGAAVSGNRLYVANQSDNTVSVIDTSTNTVIDNIAVPSAHAVVASGNRLYVTNVSNDTVTVIDTTTNTVIDTNPATPAVIDPIAVGDNPYAITVSGNRLYVANASSHTVTVIDTTTNTVLATLNVGSSPLAITADGNHVYTANQGSGTVTVITTEQ